MDVIINFHFGLFFCPFHSLTTWKIKIKKNWKKHPEISSFYNSVPKIMIICYTVPEIWCMTDVICIFHFGLFLAQKIKILGKWRKHLGISSFYICVPKLMVRWCMVPEIWCATDAWNNRQTDGREKLHVEVGAPPKKFTFDLVFRKMNVLVLIKNNLYARYLVKSL